MATRQHNYVFIAWIFLFQLRYLLPFADSFSMRINRSTTKTRWQRRDGMHQRQRVPLTPSHSVRQNAFSTTALAISITESDEKSSASEVDAPINEDENLDMPWSDVQEWALNDNLPKFTVIIPPPITGGKPRKYAMWRSLVREIPELAGYPVPFLLRMHQRSLKKESTPTSGNTAQDTPGVLPMVDDFEFASNGGIVGRSYGLPGIADGTRIQTPSLISAETTVPLGYVTAGGESGSDNEVGFSYELGTCASASAYSLDGTERSAALAAARRMVLEGAFDSSRQVASVAKDAAVAGSGLLSDSEANRDLVYLGGATAMLLASATAVGLLSHHLTVNVFWV